MRKRSDLVGKRFGRLTVIEMAGVKRHHAQWLCQCDCGLTTLSYAYQLNNGSKQSCGCLRTEEASKHIPPAKKAKTIQHTNTAAKLVELRDCTLHGGIC